MRRSGSTGPRPAFTGTTGANAGGATVGTSKLADGDSAWGKGTTFGSGSSGASIRADSAGQVRAGMLTFVTAPAAKMSPASVGAAHKTACRPVRCWRHVRATRLPVGGEYDQPRRVYTRQRYWPRLGCGRALDSDVAESDSDRPGASLPRGRRPRLPAWTRRRVRWVAIVLVTLAGVLAGLLVGRGALGLAPGGSGSARPTIVVAIRPTSVPAAPSPLAGPAPASPASPAPEEYVVEPGDSLQAIAQRVYGDANLWPRIYAANRDVIGPNPDALQAGTRLRI